MPIKNWSETPASNTSAPPNGAPEGMAPSAVNDIFRQQMADHKTQWLNGEWFDHGDSGLSRASASTFKLTGDVTAKYLANRRLKFYDATTLYGTIITSSYSAPDTTVMVDMDSGALTASLTAVAIAILSPSNLSVPATIGRKSTTLASATTTDLSAGVGDFVDVSGTTTITAFGTVAAGVEKTIRFTGALTLTHNATSLILPGAVNITTANGDIARMRSLGSGNWVCVDYTRASGANVVIGVKGADIASDTTTNLAAATGDYVDVTGTTTITGLGTVTAGIERTIRFTGALTLTHNATSLILPGAANITTANGDVAVFISLGSGNWVCVSYLKSDGTAIVATVAPSASAQSDQETGTSTTTYVSPGRQQFHPSAAKCWIKVTFSGGSTPTNAASYNIASITDSGLGITTVTIGTDFSSDIYAIASSFTTTDGSGTVGFLQNKSQAAGSYQVVTSNTANTNFIDADFSSIAFGDQ